MKRLAFRMFKIGHCRQIEKLSCRTAPWRGCNFPALVTLITHPGHGHILFDTGYAPAFFTATARFPERLFRMVTPVTLPDEEILATQLTRAGIAVGDVRTLVLSHFHPDHMAGLADFPHARVLCARDGFDAIRSASRWSGLRQGMITLLLPPGTSDRTRFFEDLPAIPLPDRFAPFERGYDIVGDGSLIAVPLPGHALGQYGLIFSAPDGRDVFLVADAAWSTDAVRHNTMPMAIAGHLLHHTRAYPRTLAALHSLLTRHAELLMAPSHCREQQAALTGNTASVDPHRHA